MPNSLSMMCVALDRTSEELAWRLVGDGEEYEALMEDVSMAQRTHVEALELLILKRCGAAN